MTSKKPKKTAAKKGRLYALPSTRLPEDKEVFYRDAMSVIEAFADLKIDGFVIYAWAQDTDDEYVDYGSMKPGKQNPYLIPDIVKKALERHL